ncbi:MAG TPA: TIGR03435 family protein [Bryobacteraceae bacterium]|nr:TIGR03435 family protein [Bryobacteraceae bacterium]
MRQALLTGGIAICYCALMFGQGDRKLSFEVASVRPSPPVPPAGGVFFGSPQGGPGTEDPSRISWRYASLLSVLMKAYQVEAYQISGPDWLRTQRYDIAVTVPPAATQEQVNVMWQNLAADRFGVALHHESKEFQVEELVVAKNGPKLKESSEDPVAAAQAGRPEFKNGQLASPGLVTMIRRSPHGMVANSMAKAQPISKLTAMLANQLHRPVLDKTGLTGIYDFNLEFTPDLTGMSIPIGQDGAAASPVDTASEPMPDLAAAVQRQLGLRLVASKARLDVIVIDRAERVPTDNLRDEGVHTRVNAAR